jgi:hypothetical protein
LLNCNHIHGAGENARWRICSLEINIPPVVEVFFKATRPAIFSPQMQTIIILVHIKD